MKKILSLIALMLGALVGYSQAPGILNYQGVARNSVGNVLVNKAITLRLTIRDGAAAGPVVYQENRAVTTNPFGLFNVQVGSPGAGSVTGTITGVNWAVGAKFIQVEIDPNGGTSFINIGTAQLASVPYSLFSALAGDLVLPFNKTQADAGTLFKITNSNTTSAGATALEGLTNSTAGNANAIIGTVTSTAPGGFSAGVRGINNGTGGLGIGVYGSQAGSGWGVYGFAPSGSGVNGASTSGTGIFGSSISGTGGRFTTTSGVSLYTSGALRHDGIGEALNRILRSDASGNATWVDPAAVGIVTGSGTLNFVPKWTPSGTNLGNSQIFDDGTNVGIGTITPGVKLHAEANAANAAIQILRNTNNAGFSSSWYLSSGGVNMGHFGYANPGAFAWGNQMFAGSIAAIPFVFTTSDLERMRITATGNVGIGIPAPAYKLDIDATSGGSNGIRIRNTSSFATVDILGVGNDQAIRFGKAGSIYAGINTLPDGDHINFFRFGGGQNLMSLNVNTGNLGVGGNPSAINAVAKAHIRGFTQANNLYLPPSGFSGVTGVASMDNVSATGNEKWGIHTFVDGSTLINHSIFAVPGTTGLDNTGLFARVTNAPVPGGNSYGLYAFDAVNNANTWAANIVGRMRYADGTQGAGKILVSDGSGNASWGTAAASGVVSGSGTLNYVPKWTPDGTTLGNSLAFDNGNSFSVGSTTPTGDIFYVSNPSFNTWVNINQVGSNVGGVSYTRANTYKWDIAMDALDNYYINNYTTGARAITITAANSRVGIGTTTPATRLNVAETDATAIRSDVNYTTGAPIFNSKRAANLFNSTNSNFGLASFNNHSIALIPGWKAAVMGVDSSNDFFSSGVAGFYKGNTPAVGVYGRSAQNFDYSASAIVNSLGYTGGNFLGGDVGVAALVTGPGTAVNKYAVWASNPGGGNNWAGFFRGQVAIEDGSEGAGKVLTSDASGNASWQGPVGIKLSGLSAVVTAPLFTFVPISQWATVEYEKGSAGNYNSSTGEYTIPVSGTYTIAAHVLWDMPAATGSGFAGVAIFVNGTTIQVGYDNVTTANFVSGNKVSTALNLTAGDLVRIEVFHNTSGNLTLRTMSYESYWSADLIK